MLDEALLASSKGRPAERLAVERLIAEFPDRSAGRALFALNTLWAGELEEAQKLAADLGSEPAGVAARAEIQGYGGDVEGAKRLLDECLAKAPDDPVVLRCAYSIFGIDDPARAMAVSKHRSTLRPHDPASWAGIGTNLLSSNVSEAEAFAENPPEAYRDTHQHWVLRARLAMKRHDLVEAERCAREAVAANSDGDMAWATLADILKLQGRKTEAAEAARHSLSLNRRNPLSMRVLAAEALARGDREEASRWEKQASVAVPALAFMEGLRAANGLLKQGKMDAALAQLEKLAHIEGSTKNAVRTMRIQMLLGMTDDAALAREAEVMEREGMTGVLLERAHAEVDRRAGRLAEARARLEGLWQSERPGVIAGPFIALLGEMKDLEAVRELARQVTDDVPGLPADAAMTFIAIDKAGLKEEARKYLASAQRKFPNSQHLAMLRVGTLAEDGNVSGAMHAMQGLEPEYRPMIRLRFRHLVKILWRTIRKRKA